MSVEAMAWALTYADTINPTETLVLVTYANYVGHNGKGAWPSLNTVAEHSRISVRTTQRTVQDLVDRGVLQRGDQQHVAHYRADRRPVVYDIPMGADAPRRGDTEERGDNLTPREMTSADALRGDTEAPHGVTPVADKPRTKPSVKRSSQPEADESEEPVRVQPTEHRPRRTRPGRRIVATEENGPGESRMVGVSTNTHRASAERTRREIAGNPTSAAGLAAEFDRRARETGLAGPQQLNPGALARNFRRWMDEGDTAAGIISMMDFFFEQAPLAPAMSERPPTWLHFINTGPKLRAGTAKSKGIDYAAAASQHQEQLVQDALNGDIRAQKALTKNNTPWMRPDIPADESYADKDAREVREWEEYKREHGLA